MKVTWKIPFCSTQFLEGKLYSSLSESFSCIQGTPSISIFWLGELIVWINRIKTAHAILFCRLPAFSFSLYFRTSFSDTIENCSRTCLKGWKNNFQEKKPQLYEKFHGWLNVYIIGPFYYNMKVGQLFQDNVLHLSIFFLNSFAI